MAQRRQQRGGRGSTTEPEGRQLRSVGEAGSGDPIDTIITGGAGDIRAEDDAVAAEAWGSRLLAVFEDARRQARATGLDVPPFEEAVLDRCRRRADADGLLVSAALTPVLAARRPCPPGRR